MEEVVLPRHLRWWLTLKREPEKLWAYFFVAPALIVLFVFRFFPLLRGIPYALSDWDGIHDPNFIGLANFRELLFEDLLFRDSVFNLATLLVTLPIWVILPLVLATIIHEGIPGGRFLRIVYFFPNVLAATIIAAIFTMVLQLDGGLNNILTALGLGALKYDWLGSVDTALWAIIAVALWANFGTGVLIYLSSLATVDQDLFDAAKVDGANWLRRFLNVTIPSIRPTVEFYTILTIRGMMVGMFAYIFVMTGGGPGSSTYLPGYAIWEYQGRINRPGYAMAASLVLFAVFMFIVLFQIRSMARRVNSEER